MGKAFVTLAAAAIVAALAAPGWLDRGLDAAGLGALNAGAQAYLDRATDRATAAFVTLSVVKTALDVLEGSTVGVAAVGSVAVQVGDVVQAVYDYVDAAWWVLLAALVALYGLKVILLVAQGVSGPLLAAAVGAGALAWVLARSRGHGPRAGRALGAVAGVLAVVWLALRLGAPLAVAGASVLSRSFTEPVAQAAHAELREAEQVFLPGEAGEGPVQRVRRFVERVERLGADVAGTVRRFVSATVRQMAVWIFDAAGFPLALFALLVALARAGVGPLTLVLSPRPGGERGGRAPSPGEDQDAQGPSPSGP
ncbi:MAG: hypothetical protein ACYDA8_04830 [Deferrisomatales bacterium]